LKKLIILMMFGIFSFASEEIFADFEVYAKQSSKLAFEGSGKVDKIFGMGITIVSTARTDEEGRALLKAFGMPFAK